MFFVGLDLAWSNKNRSGVAVLEGNRETAKLKSCLTLFSDKEIVEHIQRSVGKQNAVVAIDAPLIVPNETGGRIAEKVVGNLFGKYGASAHSANRRCLSQWSGRIRGEEISQQLRGAGFCHYPYIKQFEENRSFFEVYPHPSMVVLFNLDKILQYKAKPARSREFRSAEFEKYQSHLKQLRNAEPSLEIPSEVLEIDVKSLKGKALKDYEDMLDAIFSAYIAYYAWTNPDLCRVLGSMKEGYILTPIFPSMACTSRLY